MPSADGARSESAIGALIRTADAGDESAAAALFTALYDELHGLAERQLRRGGGQLTLGTTTLLHEAYLTLADREATRFPDRARFLAYASRAMRGLVVDYARRRQAKKRGGEFHIVTERDASAPLADEPAGESLDRLSAALDALAGLSPGLAELVDLHFFSGFSLVEIAELRGVSERTVQRDWRKARLLLHHLMRPAGPE
jgi:RNA polymerase sigma factor (TIGR02999 family)